MGLSLKIASLELAALWLLCGWTTAPGRPVDIVQCLEKDAREQAHQRCYWPQYALLSCADRENPPSPVVSLHGHGAPVVAVAWAFDERRLASSDVSTSLVALLVALGGSF